ncbi:MAG: glycoside hydrolase family 127 protein, partial [Anaerolineales bacterium]|nr:glycoside hydrolase family 127 protein [Anaerolineales bacterium]
PRVQLRQQTDYPWHGEILLTVSPEKAATFTLKLRLPGWAQGQPVPSDLYRYWQPQPSLPQLLVNDQPHPVLLEDGFIHIHRRWQPGDRVSLTLPMPVQRVLSHPAVTENQGRVALERGPLVYCAEGVDNEGRLSELSLADTAPLTARYEPDLLNGMVVIRGGELTAVPYYAWSHRGEGEMAVWLTRHAD